MTDRDKKKTPMMPTVEFDRSLITASIKADLRNNIETLDEIEPSDISKVYDAAVHVLSRGGNLASLSQTLMNFGIGRRRASEISRYLCFNASALIEVERYERIGIKLRFGCTRAQLAAIRTNFGA